MRRILAKYSQQQGRGFSWMIVGRSGKVVVSKRHLIQRFTTIWNFYDCSKLPLLFEIPMTIWNFNEYVKFSRLLQILFQTKNKPFDATWNTWQYELQKQRALKAASGRCSITPSSVCQETLSGKPGSSAYATRRYRGSKT